jgi:hypothetical protein
MDNEVAVRMAQNVFRLLQVADGKRACFSAYLKTVAQCPVVEQSAQPFSSNAISLSIQLSQKFMVKFYNDVMMEDARLFPTRFGISFSFSRIYISYYIVTFKGQRVIYSSIVRGLRNLDGLQAAPKVFQCVHVNSPWQTACINGPNWPCRRHCRVLSRIRNSWSSLSATA